MNYKYLVRFINGNEISQIFCEDVRYLNIDNKDGKAEALIAALHNPAIPITTDESMPFTVDEVTLLEIPYQAVIGVMGITTAARIPNEASASGAAAH